ncbi:MAG: lytic transglycosylase domain-containing protein [Chitinophagaceae bacterium]|nr:lytic transglycosylase domain-containing protein [Chitinophagaceae bacterium]
MIVYILYTELNTAKSIKNKTVTSTSDITGNGFVAKPFKIPDSLSFAGEPLPLHINDVRERLDRELQINSYLHSSTLFIMKRANRWLPVIDSVLKAEGIPSDFKYLPLIESALLNVVSPKEAAGFWQIVKAAGKEYGLEINKEVDERYDVVKATQAACAYLKEANRKFNNWTLAAASYNRGMSGLQKAIENQKVNSYYDLYLNDETARYIFRIVAMKEIIENPERYGFDINKEELYTAEPVKYLEVNETIKDLPNFALQHNTNYKTLKRLNPWLREDYLPVKKNKTYTLALPR